MFFFAHFKRNYGFARPGDVFWVDDKAASQIPKHVLFEMLPSTRLMRVDPHTGDKNFLIVRSGGIGDILALSDIARSATKVGMKVMMVTQKKMFPVVRWWSEQPASLKHFDQPLWNVKRQKLTDFLSDWGMMHGEDEIEKGGDRNWFQVFADASGFPCTGRPQLRDIRLSIGVRNKCWGDMIIVTRSTSVMRTAPPEVFTKIQEWWNTQQKVGGVWIDIDNASTEEYLCMLYDAEMVVSVDTAAIHFREGLGKKALGVYSAFSTDCRTKYYTHTRSFDVKSKCEFQPCYLHDNIGKCFYISDGEKSAPCLTPSFNPTVEDQIFEQFKKYTYGS